MVQLSRAKNAFRTMLVKFVNVNQTFYESQKVIIGKFSNLIISLDKSIKENRDDLHKTKLDFDNQTPIIKDCSLKLVNLNKRVESCSSEIGKLNERLDQKSTAVRSTKSES